MNLFARILSHGFALVVVALLAIGLIYRGELFSEYDLPDFLSLGLKPGTDTAAQVAEPDKAGLAEPAQPAAGDIGAGMPPSPEPEFMPSATIERSMPESATTDTLADEPAEAADVAGKAVTGMAEETVDAGAAVVQQEAVTPVAEPQEAPQAPPQPATDEAGMAAEEPAVATATAPAMPAEPGREAPAYDDTPTAASHAPATPAVTPYRILAAAREAYWLRDYAAAEQKYQELIALDPGNPDGYGELGNMYFSQGDWDRASASYYEAGTRLAAQGMYDRARQLVEVIRGLNGGQAGDLEQLITAAESAAP